MAEPFIGEIKMLGCNFAPRNYAFCNGQLLAIAQNTALFSLLGTFYGGNGTTNFALPNLQGRIPISQGQGPGLTNRQVGEQGGVEQVSVLQSNLPAHNHLLMTQAATADRANANTAYLGRSQEPMYVSGSPSTTLSPTSVTPAGSSLPHNNMQPFLVINFVIAQFGVFPSRS